jgi:vacuolar-type H+-ATPase subunit F/Vma7
MAAIVVIGDEASCAGFRLAGVDARWPPLPEAAAEFAQALESAQLVVLTRRHAAALPPGMLDKALRRESPLVVVMPEIGAPDADPGFVRRMRAVLGIET